MLLKRRRSGAVSIIGTGCIGRSWEAWESQWGIDVMKRSKVAMSALFCLALVFGAGVEAARGQTAQDFARWKAEVASYKVWLDKRGANGTRVWTRIDSTRRPHKLYVAEAFYELPHHQRIEFIEMWSRYLAGHPEKYALLDIYDAGTQKHIGEFGWGGYRLY